MSTVDERFAWTGGLADRLPEPADFGLALAEGFARRIGMLSRRLGAPAAAARWAARAAFAASRATAAGHVCVSLHALAQRYDEPFADVSDTLAASGVTAFGGIARGGECPLVVDRDGRLYLARYFEYETRLATALVARARSADAAMGGVGGLAPEALGERLVRYFGPQKERGVDWQRVAALVALTGGVTIVSGGPGTGKTTTVAGVIACLLDAHPDLRIALAAPTGKAAQRMQEALHARAGSLPAELAMRLPQKSYTLHRLLGGGPGGRFAHHRDNPLPYDLVIVDEASMIDVALAAHLLDALAPNTRLVLLGDKDQLAAVEAGAVFAELSAQPAFSATACTTIARALGIDEAEFVAALPDGIVRDAAGIRTATADTREAVIDASAAACALANAAVPAARAMAMAADKAAAEPAPPRAGRRGGARESKRAADDAQGSLFAFDDESTRGDDALGDAQQNRRDTSGVHGASNVRDVHGMGGAQRRPAPADDGIPADLPWDASAAEPAAWIDAGELAWLDNASFSSLEDAATHAASGEPGTVSAAGAVARVRADAVTGMSADAGVEPGASASMTPVESTSSAALAAAPLTDCVVWLERNYRFGLDSPIGRLSLAIRRGAVQDALDALSTADDAAARLCDDGGATLSAATIERIAQGFAGYAAALRDALATPVPDSLPLFDVLNRFRVLCATRTGARGADEVNARVAAEVRRAMRVPLAIGAHWFAGRPVMVTRNDYALGLFNGDIGIALPDARGALRVWFRGADGRARAVSPAALPPHDTAFALTVHKSQGSEFDDAALILPASFNRVLSRELVYTAITRARSRVQIIGPRAVLALAIATRTARDSGLAARIADALRARPEGTR
ncbi:MULTISPECIES: AAA family ATPase [Burkholderia]|uniref:RecBCD enzyme subunit RecD n=1 Tax=Burkholderia mayonis TaxID=1385591 RepID=A0A1B4FF98_9BURK|nr:MULTISPECIES: AAA family ATPase [Burkholderia]AOJ02345.1 exodeoxyribonuclease V subunit alpha [Burkholderia mayonis]KVE36102.1 exodeoxyribonuclease V subunit alpha [Burkholderia sp. BDU5]KVE47090.1 exodeoxyribonuclease V subunit alpha [Burkholderia mayonis]